MKQTTTRTHASWYLPTWHIDTRSDLSIVRDTNDIFGSNISVKTASMTVREGQIGILPKRACLVCIIEKHHWNFMKNAFISFLKLEQAHNKK